MTEPVQFWSRIAYLSPLALDSTLCSRDLQVRLSYVLRIANFTSRHFLLHGCHEFFELFLWHVVPQRSQYHASANEIHSYGSF